ncbi:MAG TPA: hypothetical protein VN445_08990 [Rectinemataceae bacterium]|nr:hypothetical protein [Rectinemataceae bacterium]
MRHLYLSLMPEALIASMLSPEEFGNYYAVGSEHTTQGQAVFFEVDPAFRHADIPIETALARCVPHENGSPKHTVYASVYRVLERIPLSAIGTLYLVTKDGRTLGIQRAATKAEASEGLHLYHELAPVRPLVASRLGPETFFDLLCGKSDSPLSIPAITFIELRLGELAADPLNGSLGDLPYDATDHLRSCLEQVKSKEVAAKVVDRLHPGTFSYRTIKNGLYIGNKKDGLAVYLLPPMATLKETDYLWWKSATI